MEQYTIWNSIQYGTVYNMKSIQYANKKMSTYLHIFVTFCKLLSTTTYIAYRGFTKIVSIGLTSRQKKL